MTITFCSLMQNWKTQYHQAHWVMTQVVVCFLFWVSGRGEALLQLVYGRHPGDIIFLHFSSLLDSPCPGAHVWLELGLFFCFVGADSGFWYQMRWKNLRFYFWGHILSSSPLPLRSTVKSLPEWRTEVLYSLYVGSFSPLSMLSCCPLPRNLFFFFGPEDVFGDLVISDCEESGGLKFMQHLIKSWPVCPGPHLAEHRPKWHTKNKAWGMASGLPPAKGCSASHPSLRTLLGWNGTPVRFSF